MRRSVSVVVFAAYATCALAAPEPSLYLPFDGSLNAAYAKGKPTPSVAAADPILSLISESFAEGVVGKAALLGPPSATYESRGNWDWRQGLSQDNGIRQHNAGRAGVARGRASAR